MNEPDIDNELQVVAQELWDAEHVANTARAHLNELVDQWSASPRKLATVAHLLRLSYIGRRVECDRDPGCCGIPDFGQHVEQFSDSKSWVHSSFSRWIKDALKHPHRANHEKVS